MSHEESNFSDEFLNAFVDDQLEADEKGRVYERLNVDEATKQRICELRTMGELMRFAYQNPPTSNTAASHARGAYRLRMGVAAAMLLALGMALGWTLHTPIVDAERVDGLPQQNANAPAESTAVAARGQAAAKPVAAIKAPVVVASGKKAAADRQVVKVLIHFNDSRPVHAKQTLDEVEGLLKFYRRAGQIARIELVVNGDGLDLLRADANPYAKRISRMQKEYDNLAFVACQNTIDRLKRETGVTAQLLPGVVVIDSGVAQIMRRQHQGWAYIQV